jgi:hypothetical protein
MLAKIHRHQVDWNDLEKYPGFDNVLNTEGGFKRDCQNRFNLSVGDVEGEGSGLPQTPIAAVAVIMLYRIFLGRRTAPNQLRSKTMITLASATPIWPGSIIAYSVWSIPMGRSPRSTLKTSAANTQMIPRQRQNMRGVVSGIILILTCATVCNWGFFLRRHTAFTFFPRTLLVMQC